MHEANAVTTALDRGLAMAGGRPGPVTFRIRDPVRAESDAVRFYARELLRDRGLGTLRLDVRVLRARCADCGAWVRPSPANPICSRCNAPLPARPGPAVVVSLSPRPWGSERCA